MDAQHFCPKSRGTAIGGVARGDPEQPRAIAAINPQIPFAIAGLREPSAEQKGPGVDGWPERTIADQSIE